MHPSVTKAFKSSYDTIAPMKKYLDTTIIGICAYYSVAFYPDAYWSNHYLAAMLIGILAFFILAEINGLYQYWRGRPLGEELVRVGVVWMGTVLVLLLTGFFLKVMEDLSRVSMAIWFVSAPLIMWGWRFLRSLVFLHLKNHGININSAAIAGADDTGIKIAELISESSDFDCKLSGIYDDRGPDRVALSEDKQGTFEDLVNQAKQGAVNTVYITLPIIAQNRIRELLDQLSDTTATVYMVPDLFVSSLLQGGAWSTVNGMPVVSIYENPFSGSAGVAKRTIDIVFSVIILLVLSIPMLMIALGIKLGSPGPVFFKQRRYGLDGREIKVLKFRSMTVCEDGDNIPQAQREDPRTTPLGAVIRRYSLDELPQFFNVLAGNMSIVGPRPHAVAHNEQYRKLVKGYMIRHRVKPGITGWAQVNGWRGETDNLEKMQKRVEHDLWYISNWSPLLDIKIILKTAFITFFNPKAY